MATVKEFEVKANTEEAVKSLEELKHELEESQEKAKELEEALAEANKEAAKGSKKSADADRESSRAKEELVRSIDRATGGYIEMGKKAFKAFNVIGKEVKSFGVALTNSFKAGTMGAKALKTAIAATGIGLLVVAVGAIAANWDSIVETLTGYNEEAEHALEAATKTREAQEASLDAITSSDNLLREQGKSEEEILKLKEAQTEEVIKASKLELEALKVKKKAEEESYKKQRDWVEGLINFMTAVPKWVVGVIDDIINSLPKEVRDFLGIGRSNMAASYDVANKQLLDSIMGTMEEATAETDALIAQQEQSIIKLENQAAGYRLQRRANQQAAYEKAEAEAKKHAEALAKIEEESQSIRDKMWEDSVTDATDKENRRYLNQVKRIGLQRKEELAAAAGNEELINAIKEKYQLIQEQTELEHQNNLKKIDEDATKAELDRLDKLEDLRLQLMDEGLAKELEALDLKYARLMEAESGNYEALLALQDLYEKEKATTQKKFDDEAVAKRKEYQNQISDIVLDAANTTIKNLMDLNKMYDESDAAAAKRAFERNKSLQIVQAIINTAGGIMTQLAVPQDALTGANFVKAALVATTGATQIATIAAQQFKEGKGAGGSAPKAPALPQIAPSFNIVGQSNTNQLLQGIAGQFANPLRAYVVGGDITSSQEMERKRIKTATFG